MCVLFYHQISILVKEIWKALIFFRFLLTWSSCCFPHPSPLFFLAPLADTPSVALRCQPPGAPPCNPNAHLCLGASSWPPPIATPPSVLLLLFHPFFVGFWPPTATSSAFATGVYYIHYGVGCRYESSLVSMDTAKRRSHLPRSWICDGDILYDSKCPLASLIHGKRAQWLQRLDFLGIFWCFKRRFEMLHVCVVFVV
jgi:hypothetical protein